MNIWEVLEIDYTEDVGTIKKAYARKLKLCHPEDDADGYQKLREAYDLAIKNAKNAVKIQDSPDSVRNNESPYNMHMLQYAADSGVYGSFPASGINVNDIISGTFENRLKGLMSQLGKIYENFSERININSWVQVLNHEAMWDLENKQLVFIEFVTFLSTHRCLPGEAWALLDDALRLQEQIEHPVFRQHYELRNYLLGVFNQRSLSFHFLHDIEYGQREKFIELRVNALECLQRKNYDLAWAYIEEAREIFDGDPELTCLEGIRYSVAYNTDAAIEAFSKVLKVMPDSVEALSGRANNYLLNDELENAKKDFEALLELNPKEDKYVTQLAEIHLKQDDPIGARKLYKKINAYEQELDKNHILNLIATNKALVIMGKNPGHEEGAYFEKELPFIKQELKKLQKYAGNGYKTSSSSVYKGYVKFIIGLVLVLAVLFLANMFYKTINNRNNVQANGSVQGGDAVQSGKVVSEASGEAEKVIDISEANLEQLAQSGEKISVTITQPQILNFIIYNSSKTDKKTLYPLTEKLEPDNENNRILYLSRNLFIGRIGDNSLFFYGSIFSILGKQKIDYYSDGGFPDEVTLEGRIERNDFIDFNTTVIDYMSFYPGYETYLASVSTKYIFKAEEDYYIPEINNNSNNKIPNITAVIKLLLILTFVSVLIYKTIKGSKH
ncbi:tetratricopeptide repeat protein [Ruminiclostridium hungatei]|uniref:Tetratricopeptide repeat protein n=1 Tax=Ruminiclostridium hungatei TaxID=48256 RepID=A0A1V4SJD6_RUMHU|nr:hypothetical protein [Ruminiclostridium hungatei]OPX43361.1 tetratricopeptide repeat protein [Ruminiclostridium hungatei]